MISNSGEKVVLDVIFSTMNKYIDETPHKDWDKKIASLLSITTKLPPSRLSVTFLINKRRRENVTDC